MNNCGETGIVGLEDLPQDEIFVKLKSDFYKILKDKIRGLGIVRLEREFGIKRNIGHWLSDGCLIRFDILIKILDYFNFDYKDRIEYIRGKDGLKLRDPRLPFDFTTVEGIRVIAGILGDGGIPANRLNPYYANSDENLINAFIRHMKFVFGDIEFNSRDMKKLNFSTVTILEFSSLIRKVFLKLGLKPGKKVETNQGILPFIFNLDENKFYAFISQFFDDEGSVNVKAKHLCLTAACLKCYGQPKVLGGIRKLFFILGIDSSIHPGRIYSSLRGKDRQIWRLQINGQFQLKHLYENLDLGSLEKEEKLSLLLRSIKLRTFRKKEFLSTYIKFMKNIQDSKGYFTSKDLAQQSGMALGSSRNTLIKFREKRLIKCIKPYSGYPYASYAQYVLV